MGFLRSPVYETQAPELPQFSKPAVLVLYKTNGLSIKTIPAGNGLLQTLAENEGWDIYVTDNAATHNFDDLNRFELVVWNNTSGGILTASQKEDFKRWLTLAAENSLHCMLLAEMPHTSGHGSLRC